MFYLVWLDKYEGTLERLRKTPRDDRNITIRGYDPISYVPDGLKGITLSVSQILDTHCETNRNLYLEVIEKTRKKKTFSSLKGEIIHDFYSEIFKVTHKKFSNVPLSKMDIYNDIMDLGEKIIRRLPQTIDRNIEKLNELPKFSEVAKFEKDLRKVLRLEAEIAGTLVDCTISKKYDFSPEPESESLFPFNLNKDIAAEEIGVLKANPDFIYKNKVIGDLKTGKWDDFLKVTYAAYSLVYECENQEEMNFGIILHPVLKDERQIPLYMNSRIELITDTLRNTFLSHRNNKFQIISKGEDPGLATNCSTACGYYGVCNGGA